MDAFDDRFREGVCTLVGGVGGCGSEFCCHCCVVVHWCTKFGL